VTRLVQPLLDLRDGGFLIYCVVIGSLWVFGSCFQIARAFRRALKMDPVTYADGKPPTLRRVIYAISWLTMGITFFPYLAFQDYFVFHRPQMPIPAEDRIYALFVHGTTVYLTPQEHAIVSNNWMAVFVGCFLSLVRSGWTAIRLVASLEMSPAERSRRAFLRHDQPTGRLECKSF